MSYESSRFTGSPHHVSVTRQPGGGCAVSITGKMPIGWLGSVTAGMGQAGLDIERADARKVAATHWEGVFMVRSAVSGKDPAGIDYGRFLASSPAAAASQSLELHSYTLREPLANHDPLYLEVKGEDRPGFLGAFLNRLAFFGLFPDRIEVSTRHGLIEDRFWLRGVGGQAPGENIAQVLRGVLDRYLVKTV